MFADYSWVFAFDKLSVEETVEAVAELRKKDSQALRDRIIMGNARLIFFKVNAYVGFYKKTSHLKDDMVAAGFVGMALAVNYLSDPEVSHTESPSGLMSLMIHREIGKLIENDNLISIPMRTKVRNNLKDIRVGTFSDSDVDYELPSTNSSLELRETIFNLAETKYEKEIIALREQGFTDSDISTKLNLPVSTINLIRRELYNSFKALSK